ncbi:MAG: helix-turn-helix domain-containing protein [Candidatus Levybacteria bacterium]|nr:helix-turn-helix domain-containing protein [Candidatus Levybacteria bacterium]
MTHKTNMSFESTFPADYRKNDIEKLLAFVKAGKFVQLISLPGGGKATILKLLAINDRIKEFHLDTEKSSYLFIYLNLLELPNFEQVTIDKFLLLSLGKKEESNDPLSVSEKLKKVVKEITGSHNQTQTLILLFDHFDEFQNSLGNQFFQRLRSLKSIAKYKFSVIFASRRDLLDLVDPDLAKEFYDFFVGNTVYMKLFDKVATEFLLSQVEKIADKKFSEAQKEKLVELSGGHTKILKVCAETILSQNHNEQISVFSLLQKMIVKASLFELWLFLTPQEQKVLLDVSSKINVEQNETLANLVQSGLLQQSSNANNNNNLIFTIPIFEEFVKEQASTMEQFSNLAIFIYNPQTKEITKGEMVISDLLSKQEFRLLRFFVENQGRILEREEIINAVWEDLQSKEGVTDQALDQLIFRLRKKIEENPSNPTHVLTAKGRGCKFIP